MQGIRISTRALLAVGLAGALGADASVANAQEKDREKGKPGAATPVAPETRLPAKTTEARPGPLDVVVQFQAGSTELPAGTGASLDQTAEWLVEEPSRQVTIEIHPDDAARADFDAAIAAKRADATMRYLVARGASDTQIQIVAAGRVSAATVGRNHRAVFVASPEGDAPVAVVDVDTSEPAAAVQPIAAPEPMDGVEDDLDDLGDGDPSDDHLLTPFGMAVTVGGGVVDFLDGEARAIGDLGGSWEARLTLGTRTPLAIEFGYIGSVHNIDALGLDSSAVLLGTSVETDLRVNFTTWMLQPYVFGGIGYTRYDVTNDDFNTSSVNEDEQMGHIPLGAGLAYQWGGFLFDVRGTVRPAFQDDLIDEPAIEDDPLDRNDTRTDLDTWSAAARLGWEF